MGINTMEQSKNVPPADRGGHRSTPAKGGRKLRNDLIFIGGLLAVLALLALLLYLLGEEGDHVVVTVDGEVYATYPLSEDLEVDIRTGENGEQVNRLVIRDGKAFVENATCPDGICAAHHPISRDGESIICLPHKVVVAVEAKS
jgi:hypothetical protein